MTAIYVFCLVAARVFLNVSELTYFDAMRAGPSAKIHFFVFDRTSSGFSLCRQLHRAYKFHKVICNPYSLLLPDGPGTEMEEEN